MIKGRVKMNEIIFYSKDQVCEKIGVSSKNKSKLNFLVEIKLICIKEGKYLKESVDDFFENLRKNYITYDELKKVTGCRDRHSIRNKLNLFEPKPFQFSFQGVRYIKREDIKELIHIYTNYYTINHLTNKLPTNAAHLRDGSAKGSFTQLFDDYIEPKNNHFSNVWLFNKKEVEDYILLGEEYKKKYMTREEVNKYLDIVNPPITLSKIIVPKWCYYFLDILGNGKRIIKYFYLKEEVERYKENNLRSTKIIVSAPSDPYEYFLFVFEKENISIPRYLKQTTELYKAFARDFFSRSRASFKSVRRGSVPSLISALKHLADFEEHKEIFSFHTGEAIKLLDECELINARMTLYKFIKFVKSSRVTKYRLHEIPNPRNIYLIPKTKVENYDIAEWKTIYLHAKNIDKHLSLAIEDEKYASTWLYILIHLTNSWRASDVTDVPGISPESIGITDISWFYSYHISLPQGQIIINQLTLYKNMLHHKTGAERSFVCNPSLVSVMASALCICEFHRRNTNRASLIFFGTKDNDVSASYLRKFFRSNEQLVKLEFKNRKANSTLMTHLFYSIQSREGKGNSAFEIAQAIRDHKSQVTKQYIAVDDKGITRQLFDRGDFGFLYDQLHDVLSFDKQTLEERTTSISNLQRLLPPVEVETTIGFLNERISEQHSLAWQMLQFSPEEAMEFAKKLYLREMPSRAQNIQCGMYNNCPKNKSSENYPCNGCGFAIPNIYAITDIFIDVLKRLNKYKLATLEVPKKRELKFIIRLLDVLSEAITAYGEEYVWSFFPGGEAAFEQNLQAISR